MAESIIVSGKTKQEKYESIIPQIKDMIGGESDFIANCSNIIAVLKYAMDFFWVGIYFVKENQLVLGPFQGQVACTRIGYGKGVCGTSWQEKQTVIVSDVDKFSEHIACSSGSKSEIVVPILNLTDVVAVLDIDSDKLNNFDETDKKYLEQIVKIINECANVRI